MDNIKKCYEYNLFWSICSNKLIIKYHNSTNYDKYYEEMNICFENYKKFSECIKLLNK